jgi:hypothetical protein
VNDFESGDTVVEAFRRANPVPDGEATNRRAQPSAHALFAEIVANPPRSPRRRARVVLAATLAVVLLAGIFLAFAIVDGTAPDVAAAPRCYETASLSARSIVVAGPDLQSACAQLFANGDLGTGTVPSSFDVCVTAGGAPAVFPGESGSVCKGLGLASANPTSADVRVRAFESQVSAAIQEKCVGYDAARDIVEHGLDQFDLKGWTVEPNPDAEPFSDARPCASIAFPGSQTVFIVPVGDPRAAVTT